MNRFNLNDVQSIHAIRKLGAQFPEIRKLTHHPYKEPSFHQLVHIAHLNFTFQKHNTILLLQVVFK